MGFGSIFALLILIGDIWALIHIFQSTATTGNKVLWVLLIVVLPLIGLVVWFFAGPRRAGT